MIFIHLCSWSSYIVSENLMSGHYKKMRLFVTVWHLLVLLGILVLWCDAQNTEH